MNFQIVNARMADTLPSKCADTALGELMEHIQTVFVRKVKRMCKRVIYASCVRMRGRKTIQIY